MISELLSAILPTVRVFQIKDGRVHQRLHTFVCVAVPRVGEYIAVEHESWPVVKVQWVITEPSVHMVNVYVMELEPQNDE